MLRSRGTSVPSELDRAFSPCLSAPSSHGQRYVWSTFAIPHFKDEHPCFARLPSRLPELPPVRSDERCGSRRMRPLRSALSISPASVLFSPRSEAPIPLMPPSPPESHQPLQADATRATKTAATAEVREVRRLSRPETPSSGQSPFSELLLIHVSETPRPGSALSRPFTHTSFHPRALDPVRSLQPQPKLTS